MSDRDRFARAFASVAAEYDRGRPEYPEEAVAWIAETLDLRAGRTVLDLAAGTGKLTQMLLATGARVVAVEPLDPMRANIEASLPQVESHAGTAEAIPLAGASVDAATVGQAFHWFDAPVALRELHRVVRPGGGVAALWNNRDERDELQAWVTELLEPLASRVFPQADGNRVNDDEGLLAGGFFTRLEHRQFPYRHEVDEQSFVAGVVSRSYVATASTEERAHVERELRRRARALPRPIVNLYVTDVYLARRA